MRYFCIGLLALFAFAAYAAVYKLTPVDLDNGYLLTGSIETDGALGVISGKNITHWTLTVTQTTDTVFTEKNTRANVQSDVTTDGKTMWVSASPDRTQDGGCLTFMGGYVRGNIPSGALVADFTATNIVGGVSGWQTPMGLNYAQLGQADGTKRAVATSTDDKHAVFTVTPVTVNTDPKIQQLIGSITTDGTVGTLAAKNFVSWQLIGRDRDVQVYTDQNTRLLDAAGLTATDEELKVSNPDGLLQFGITATSVRGRGIIVTLADFTDPTMPDGTASYYFRQFGQVGFRAPLTHNPAYVVARRAG